MTKDKRGVYFYQRKIATIPSTLLAYMKILVSAF